MLTVRNRPVALTINLSHYLFRPLNRGSDQLVGSRAPLWPAKQIVRCSAIKIFRQLSSTAARLRCKVFQIDRRISQQGEYNAAGGTSPGCRVPGV
jgi:hypothetical protein